MTEQSNNSRGPESAPNSSSKTKRKYKKPAFECERAFETMALACGKVSATQAVLYPRRSRQRTEFYDVNSINRPFRRAFGTKTALTDLFSIHGIRVDLSRSDGQLIFAAMRILQEFP